MSNRIKYNTGRDSEFHEFPKDSITLIMPNGVEFAIGYNNIEKGLTITKLYGTDDDDSAILIRPCVSNSIVIK